MKDQLLKLVSLTVLMTAAGSVLPSGRLEKCARRVFALVFAAVCAEPVIGLIK